MTAHEHEKWHLQESAKGGMYCAACGEHVTTARDEARIERARAALEAARKAEQ